MLEYDGSTHQLKRRSQERLTYECVRIHRPNRIKDENLCCCHECMTGTILYDEDGHFNKIKDYLCRLVVLFQGNKFNYFQSPSSTINE